MKKVVISGSSGHLGGYLSRKFMEKNFHVIGISRSKDVSFKLKEFYKCDLSRDENVKTVLKKIKKKHKKIDLFICCSGFSKKNYVKEISSNSFIESFKNNFFSFSNILEYYSKNFNYSSTKFIVISSIAGVKDIGAPVTYSTSKNSLNFYCKLKAKELAKYNIKINIISPGNILMKNNIWDLNVIIFFVRVIFIYKNIIKVYLIFLILHY